MTKKQSPPKRTSGITRRTASAAALMVILASCGSSSAGSTAASGPTSTVPGSTTSEAAESAATTEVTQVSETTDSSESETAAPVTQAGILFPIGEGELENWKAALADLIGPNYADYEASRGRFGLDQQTTVLQSTPMGNFALIYMEGPDLNNTMMQMATSEDEWDVQWRSLTTGLHDTDFNDPDALAFDAHLVLSTGDLTDAAKAETQPFNFFVPLSPDDADAMTSDLDDVMTNRLDEYVAARAAIGVAEEKVFLQNTAVGPGIVVYWEAADPQASLQRLLASEAEFDVWFQTQFGTNHSIPNDVMMGIWSNNELIADFPARS